MLTIDMIKKIHHIVVLSILLLFSSNVLAFSEIGYPKSSSGIKKTPYNEMVVKFQQIVSNNSDFSSLINIGKSTGGLDTWAILVQNKNVPLRKIVFISGATHGNEYLNIEDKLLEGLLDANNFKFFDFYQKGGAFLVLPIVNPDGYLRWIRGNNNLKDINRDFPNTNIQLAGKKEIETRNIINVVDSLLSNNQQASLVMALDYHCCLSGTLLYPWGYTGDDIPESDLQRHQAIGEMMTNIVPETRYGGVDDYLWYFADGTSMDYWYQKYNALAFTFEGNSGGDAEFAKYHLEWLGNITEQILQP